ncbi:MAG: NAD(P)-binding protein [Candidatus Aminicenantia bacterium]
MGIIRFEKLSDFPYMPVSITDTLYNKTGSWRTFRPVHINKLPPCNHACPTGENVQRYIYLILKGKYEEAYRTIKEDNPFPSITGRVCFHPCESACNRDKFDEAIAIHHIERFLGDLGLKLKDNWKIEERKERIGIIGSGPAGLACAYHLRRKGYKVRIFEAEDEFGGLLRYGIPSYRLPKEILDAELKKLEEMGIEFSNNQRIKSPHDLLGEFDAVFVGIGATLSQKMGVEGEETEGILKGIEFLKRINKGEEVKLGKKVAVIGGGNTAIDSARCALRLGADLEILYRRSRNEMPAIKSEIEDAESEGIEIKFLVSPTRVIVQNGKLTGLECIRMELGEPDESGRRKPVPVKGSEFTINIDNVIIAIGEKVDIKFFDGLTTTNWGVKGDYFGRTSSDRIFAGGDCLTGPATVVEALGAGKKAAMAIDSFLKGILLPSFEERVPVPFENLNTNYFKIKNRIEPDKLEPSKRKSSFNEVWKGYEEDTLKSECERCFSCGVCNACDNCWVFCPDASIVRNEDEYGVNYDYCKGCGLCAKECPRNVIDMEEER